MQTPSHVSLDLFDRLFFDWTFPLNSRLTYFQKWTTKFTKLCKVGVLLIQFMFLFDHSFQENISFRLIKALVLKCRFVVKNQTEEAGKHFLVRNEVIEKLIKHYTAFTLSRLISLNLRLFRAFFLAWFHFGSNRSRASIRFTTKTNIFNTHFFVCFYTFYDS